MSWASALPKGQLGMKQKVLQEYVSDRFPHSQGQHKIYWNEFDQNNLGQTQSPVYWPRVLRFVHAQMGSAS